MKMITVAFLSSVTTSLCFIFLPDGKPLSNDLHSEVLLQTSTSWDGTPINYPEGQAEVSVVKIELAPGAETGWHHHPVPSFAYILQGQLEVRLEDGTTIQKTAGEALAEVTNTVHNGKNIGDESLSLVVFYTGAQGSELTIMHN